MALTREEVRSVAALARLELDEAEEELFASQLSRVLDYIDQLAAYEAIEPEPESAEQVGSEDRPAPGLDPEAVVANAPAAFGHFVVVPRVLEGDA
jgi:aspartyl-tRNA(Asn)/glutamyl-tRNA(Gln) amidotransferase subunit C